MNRSFDSKHLVFTTRASFVDHESRYCPLLLFCVQEINRFLEIPNRGSQKILRVSQNSILDPRTSKSKLAPRNWILDSQKLRGSRIEFRVETVNLHLPGTVSQPQIAKGSSFLVTDMFTIALSKHLMTSHNSQICLFVMSHLYVPLYEPSVSLLP